jgi:hypothetical protein
MMLTCRRGALDEADPLSRRHDTVPHATFSLFWDGNLRWKSQSWLKDPQFNLLTLIAMRLSHDFADLIRDGYSLDSFHGGQETFGMEPYMVTFGALVAFVSRGTLSSD